MPFFSYSLDPALSNGDPIPARAKYLDARVPRDLAIDPVTRDLEIPVRLVSGAEAILQRIWIRLRFFLGEWFLDARLGFPWFERVFVKGADHRAIRALMVKCVGSVPHVARVVNLESSIDTRARLLTVSRMTVVVDDGIVIDAREGQPFILIAPEQVRR